MASKTFLDKSGLTYFWGKVKSALAGKQDTLVSGTNIKSINGNSLLGSGDMAISGSGSQVSFTQSLTSGTAVGTLTIDGDATTLYAPTNTDTKVTQTVRSTNGSFPILLRGTSAGTSTTTTTTSFGTAITANPSTGKITATSGSVASGDTDLVTGGAVYAAIPQLSTSTTSTSTTTAATPSAVRTAYHNGAWYGTCGTAAATKAKVVTCANFSSAGGLVAGAHITVKFTYNNTVASPTMNVNSTGAIPIFVNGAAALAGAWYAGEVKEFVYDGTNWVMSSSVNNHYSTSEVWTGEYWIDGSKIYKKTIQKTGIVEGENQIAHGVTGLKLGIKIEASIALSGASAGNTLLLSSQSATNFVSSWTVGGSYITLWSSISNTAWVGYYTIYYTKSS